MGDKKKDIKTDTPDGIWHEFDHAAGTAVLTVTLDRATGLVEVDQRQSTPMETWAMLSHATDICAIKDDRLEAL